MKNLEFKNLSERANGGLGANAQPPEAREPGGRAPASGNFQDLSIKIKHF